MISPKEKRFFLEAVTNIRSKEIKIAFFSVKAVDIYLKSLTVCRGWWVCEKCRRELPESVYYWLTAFHHC